MSSSAFNANFSETTEVPMAHTSRGKDFRGYNNPIRPRRGWHRARRPYSCEALPAAGGRGVLGVPPHGTARIPRTTRRVPPSGGCVAQRLQRKLQTTVMDTLPSHLSQAILPHDGASGDDPMSGERIAEYLGQNDLRVTTVPDEQAVKSLLEEKFVDLILLNVKLPTQDAITLAKRLRELSAIPIILLTDRSEAADRVMGLEMGADDCLTSPTPRALLARIRALLRRQRTGMRQRHSNEVRAYRFDGWQLNLGARRLTAPDGRQIALRNREFSLLVLFLGSPQRVFTRRQLLRLSCLHSDR